MNISNKDKKIKEVQLSFIDKIQSGKVGTFETKLLFK